MKDVVTDTHLEALVGGELSWRKARAHFLQGGGHFRNADLSDRDLRGLDLADVDFSGADFFGTELSKANLKMARLQNADLTKVSLDGAGLYKCGLSGAVVQEATLRGADLSSADCVGADFRGSDLSGANLAGADLRFADLGNANLEDADLTGAVCTEANFSGANFYGANVTRLEYGGFKAMGGRYFGIRSIDNAHGNALFVRDAKDQDYIDALYHKIERLPDGWMKTVELFLFRAWGLIDHGRSLVKVSCYAFVIAMLYGAIYTLDMRLGWAMMDYSNSAQSWFTPFYYSMVTYTTLGYGDVTANSLAGEMLVISEVVIGYFTLGLLLSILANTIARRS
jgi:hypothetical protein